MAGLTSRWTSPWRCAASSAPATSSTIVDRAHAARAAARAQQLAQVGALDVAHRHVEQPVLLAGVEDRDGVGMVDRRREPALALEARAEHRVLGEARRDQLQRDRPVERRGRWRDRRRPSRRARRCRPRGGRANVEPIASSPVADAGPRRPRGRRVAKRAPSPGSRYVPAGHRDVDRLDELRLGGVLEHVRARPRRERLAGVLELVVHGHHDDHDAGRGGEEARGSRRGSACPAS